MASFPISFEESNLNKKDLIKRWIVSRIDHSCLEREQPMTFTGRTSFYHIELPDFRRFTPLFKARVFGVLVDEDVKDDLERVGLINWCPNVSTMIPLSVPSDGNCLLHSVATAIWGIRDTDLMLRRVLGVVLAIDIGHRFHSRWLNYQQNQLSQLGGRVISTNPEHLSREWTEITQCLDPDKNRSSAVPHRFLEAIHVYTLANILRRPIIIVTDPTMRTFSGLSLQDNDMGGIYLPLEWKVEDTWRTPVVLAYTHSHFSPLVVTYSSTHGTAAGARSLILLVNKCLQQLPVRFLSVREGPGVGQLLRRYLKVRETVMVIDGQLQTILCTELDTLTLSEELCLVRDYFQLCEQMFQQEILGSFSSELLPYHTGMSPEIAGPEMRYQPSYQSGIRSQTPGSPQVTAEREQAQRIQNNQYIPSGPPLSLSSGWGQGEVQIPAPSFTPYLSYLQQNASMRSPQDKKCVRPGCEYCGDPELGMMCSKCFRNYTIKESRQLAAGRAARTMPTAPLPSMQEEEQQPLLSMMTERCLDGCGFRCSTRTFPYCHECASKRQRMTQQTADLRASEAARTPASSGRAEQAAGGVTPAAELPGQPQEGARVQRVSPLNDLNKTQASPGIGPHSPQIGLTFSAGGKSSEIMSPSKVLESGSLLAPLTPPEGSRDELLFGPGEVSGNLSAGVAHLLQVNAPQSQILEQAKPWTSEPPKTPEQPLISLARYSQPQQLPPPGYAPGQDSLVPYSLGESHVFGPPGAVCAGTCTKEGCRDTAVYQGMCGKCYISKGMPSFNLSNPAVEKLKLPSLCSTSSSAPASVGPTNAAVGPPSGAGYVRETEVTSPSQARNRAFSLTNITAMPPAMSSGSPQRPTNDMRFVKEWLNESSRRSEDIQASGRSPFPENQPLGLPERQETATLGNDLVESGLACCSPPRCMGEGCSNTVEKEGTLCDRCQGILRQFHQTQRSNVSVQGPRRVEEQTHPQASPGSRTFPINRSISDIPPYSSGVLHLEEQSTRAPPSEQHGRQCSTAGCSMYGDPKQAGMCWNHYQHYLNGFATAAAPVQSVPPASQPVEGQGLDHLSTQTASLGDQHERNQQHPVQVADPQTPGGFAPNQGGLPVLPPSARLSVGVPSRGEDLSLGETYNRVAVRQLAKCLNPACSNYGNPRKGGICNSCAADEKLANFLIYGEEAIG